MKKFEPARDEQFRQLAKERLVRGDLFEYEVPVVTVKTQGRTYGSLSRAVAATGVKIPELALGCAKLVTAPSGKRFIFVAFWDDKNEHTPRHVYACTLACVKQASVHRVEKLAMPLLGGKDRASFLGAMEQAVDHAEDDADEHEAHMPSVVFVTDKELL